MKYMVITSLFRPIVRGGAEVVVEDIVDELKKKHDVSVITLCPWRGMRSLFLTSKEEDGVKMERFYPLTLFSFIDINSKPYILRTIWHLLDIFNIHSYAIVYWHLRRHKPDCVLTHNIKGIGYLIPLAIKHARIRHIHTLHDIQLVLPTGLMYWKKEQEEKKLHNRFHAWCSRLLFGSPDIVISPSRFLEEYYKKRNFFPHSRYLVLRNPVCAARPQADQKPQSAIQSPLLHFLYAGTLNEAKGILFLCKTFCTLPDQNIRLVIAGSGPDEEEIRKLCALDTRIVFLGRLKHDALLDALSTMQYAVVPSLCYENAPTIIAESFSFGIPVIAADIGGTAESIEDEKNGFVFVSGDQSSLAHALNRAINCERYGELQRSATSAMRGRDCTSYIKQLIQIQKQ